MDKLKSTEFTRIEQYGDGVHEGRGHASRAHGGVHYRGNGKYSNGYSCRSTGGWRGYYLNSPYYYSPYIKDESVSTLSFNTPGPINIIPEGMQNTNLTDWQQISSPWVSKPEPPVCSLIQATWDSPISKLSTDSTCFCPVGNKASNITNNTTFYKCQIPYPSN